MKKCFIYVKGSPYHRLYLAEVKLNFMKVCEAILTTFLSREEEMQDLNRMTNSRMAWLGFLSLAICLSVAGLQLWHLKTFFERKKLL
jgi:hypothetical protein